MSEYSIPSFSGKTGSVVSQEQGLRRNSISRKVIATSCNLASVRLGASHKRKSLLHAGQIPIRSGEEKIGIRRLQWPQVSSRSQACLGHPPNGRNLHGKE